VTSRDELSANIERERELLRRERDVSLRYVFAAIVLVLAQFVVSRVRRHVGVSSRAA
jgi:hypothetical protein